MQLLPWRQSITRALSLPAIRSPALVLRELAQRSNSRYLAVVAPMWVRFTSVVAVTVGPHGTIRGARRVGFCTPHRRSRRGQTVQRADPRPYPRIGREQSISLPPLSRGIPFIARTHDPPPTPDHYRAA